MSYLGSTINTRTNLHEIHIASLDLIHQIPFIFIPVGQIFTTIEIEYFIGVKIVNQGIQALSWVSRNLGQFKISLLNRCLRKQINNLTLNNFFNSKSFKEKFEQFKIFEPIDIQKHNVFMYLNNLLKKREP